MVMSILAAAAVVCLLLGFVTLCVVWTARVVSRSVRQRSVALLATYDGLLEDRSHRLAELDSEIEQAQAELEQARQAAEEALPVPTVPEHSDEDPMAYLKVVEQISGTGYQESGGGSLYRKIRESFTLAPKDVLPRLDTGAAHEPGPAGQLLEKLSYDSICRLSTLPHEEQKELLAEVLPPPERALLQEYAAAHSRFDCIAFYDYLQARAAAEPAPACLRVPPTAAGPYPGGVRVVVDEDICEGFQLEMDNRLYDYCVKMREMGE